MPALAFAGWLGEDLPDLGDVGIAGVAGILPRPLSLEEAMRDAESLLRAAVGRTLRIYETGRTGDR